MEEVVKAIDKELQIEREDYMCTKDKDDCQEDEEGSVFHYKIHLDTQSIDNRVLAPFKYTISVPGKNFRKSLVQALNYWLRAPKHIEDTLSELIYFVHNYSLMIDDIQDYSDFRRGQPCCHNIFGVHNTINSIAFLSAYNLRVLLSFNDPMLLRINVCVGKDLLRGQAMEIYWRDNCICPTEEEYKKMITLKTGGLFFFANNILQYYSKENVDTTRFLTALSLFFQINDDYQNLCSDYFHEHKGFCDDISEGKFGFPVIYVVNNFPEEGKIILDILRQKTKDMKLKIYCKSLIEKCGGFEYTRQVLKQLKANVADEAEKLGPNAYFDENVLRKLIQQSFT